MPSSDQFNAQQLGQYLLVQRLGGGSTGIVYKAQHLTSKRTVAIKVLSPSIARNPVALTRFRREFEATRTLKHRFIVPSIEIAQERTLFYLVMEFIEGHSLDARLETEGKLGEDQAVRATVQIADALHYAHSRGLIHRDVKPSNILLMPNGEARLTDFGLVKNLDSSSTLTESASMMGTPNFMAPEQFDDARQVDARSDLYALAATLYAAVTGQMPFAARGYLTMVEKKFAGDLVPPRSLNPELTPRTEKAIIRALSVNPMQRQQSCAEFIMELTDEPVIRALPHTAPLAVLHAMFGRMRKWIWPNREHANLS